MQFHTRMHEVVQCNYQLKEYAGMVIENCHQNYILYLIIRNVHKYGYQLAKASFQGTLKVDRNIIS